LGKFPRKPWREKYPHADPLALDLLDQMLAFNPGKRISVEADSVYSKLHCPEGQDKAPDGGQ